MQPVTASPPRDAPLNAFAGIDAIKPTQHNAEVLAYRAVRLQEESLLSAGAQQWIVGVLSLVALILMGWTLRKTFPELGWGHLPQLWTHLVQKLAEKDFTWSNFLATVFFVKRFLPPNGSNHPKVNCS